MSAGTYPHRIRFEAPIRTTNADGQAVVSWPEPTDAPYATLWANVRQTGGGQGHEHEQQQAENVYEITLRASPLAQGITTAMRIVFRGRYLQVGSVDDIEFRGREVMIRATEKRPAAA